MNKASVSNDKDDRLSGEEKIAFTNVLVIDDYLITSCPASEVHGGGGGGGRFQKGERVSGGERIGKSQDALIGFTESRGRIKEEAV